VGCGELFPCGRRNGQRRDNGHSSGLVAVLGVMAMRTAGRRRYGARQRVCGWVWSSKVRDQEGVEKCERWATRVQRGDGWGRGVVL
jgi:hypothetical protein